MSRNPKMRLIMHSFTNQFPDTATHTAPGVVDASPTCRTTGTYPPGCTPVGICTLICINPATYPGEPPAYCTNAGIPPTVTLTGRAGRGGAPADAVVWPSPVA